MGKKRKRASIPYKSNMSEADRLAILNGKSIEATKHRYAIDRFSSPTMSISSNGLISVDSRYSKLYEDYDDK